MPENAAVNNLRGGNRECERRREHHESRCLKPVNPRHRYKEGPEKLRNQVPGRLLVVVLLE